MKKLRKQAVTDMFGNVIGYECAEKEIRIVECSKEEADMVIVPHHYSHKVTKNSCINLLVLYRGGGKRSNANWIWDKAKDKGRT